MLWLWSALVAGGMSWVGQWIFRPVQQVGLLIALPTETGAEAGPNGGSEAIFPGAVEACLDFQDAALRMTGHLELIRRLGNPPRVMGAFWTWPHYMRSIRVVIDAGLEGASALARVRVYGSAQMTAEVHRAGMAIARVTQVIPTGPPNKQDPKGAQFDEALVEARQAISDIGALARTTTRA